jgi:hypothetical protein
LSRRYGPQEAGRSSGFPVHWPLWPPPLPPFVGGGGFPTADPIVAAKINPANMLAMTLRSESFTPHNLLSASDLRRLTRGADAARPNLREHARRYLPQPALGGGGG